MSVAHEKRREHPGSLVSVVMPVYNCQSYLAEAIESVLAQTYSPAEIIVVDDGSTDSSAAVAGQYTRSIKYSYQPNAGIAEALNKGIKMSNGGFLSFLDADDMWTPMKLEYQMSAMSDTNVDMVFGKIEQFYSPELDQHRGNVEVMPGFSKGTLLVRRQSFFRVGLFNKQLQLGDFIEWYLRAAEVGLKSLMLPEIVMRRRIHKGNMGIRQRGDRADYVRILKASLDRRRNVH
jgi:glycosyltransferase involved in cell wall biosynthesis